MVEKKQEKNREIITLNSWNLNNKKLKNIR